MKPRRERHATLTCTGCGTKQSFTAEDGIALIKAMDLAGWGDSPEAEAGSGKALCRECHRKSQQEGN